MVVGDEIQLGPRSCTFNVCSNESCKEKEDFQINTSWAFFDCSELWTVSHFNSFILITYLISLILLSWNYASPLAFTVFSESPDMEIQVAETDVWCLQ